MVHFVLRWSHILGGLAAILAGFTVLYAVKGAPLHRKVGLAFVVAMLVNATSGTILSVVKLNRGNVMGGSMSLYMVATALLTTRRRVAAYDVAAMILGLGVAATAFTFAYLAAHSADGRLDGYPPPLYIFFGSIAALSVAGDIRMVIARGLQGRHRLVRHLWRMSFAMFIATGSFFLGQAKLLPREYRIVPLLSIPVLVPLALMVYWLLHVTFARHYPRRA